MFEHLQQQFEYRVPDSVITEEEQTRDRKTQRTVSVLATVEGLEPTWRGVKRLVRVERRGTRSGQPFSETMFYISSLELDAAGFAQWIRRHWHIENRLHWPKDVVLQEDSTPWHGHALINGAILRTIAVNLFRQAGFASITKGMRHLAHDVHRLFSFFQ